MLSTDESTHGHYYRKQIQCASSIIAWSHASRFGMGLRLLDSSTHRLLDYGCGDGTFLAMAAKRVKEGWGVDIAADQIEDCRDRLAHLKNVHFVTIQEVAGDGFNGSFDVVTCMETLEHCTNLAAESVLRDLRRLVRQDGRVLISVPVEIGPTFLLKLAVRRIAAWRGLSDYRHYESYTLLEALRMMTARATTVFGRPTYGPPGRESHSHYGFNWRALLRRVEGHFYVEKLLFSPLGNLGGWFSSQVWFVCRPGA